MDSLTLRAMRRELFALLPAPLQAVTPGPGGAGLALVLGPATVVLDAGGRRPPIRVIESLREAPRPRGKKGEFEWTGAADLHEVAWQVATRSAGGRVTRVAGIGLERILALTIEQRDRFGDPRRTTLILEIFGAFVNLLVVDGGLDGTIVSRLRDDRRGSAGSRLERSRRYEPPPRDRIDLELDGPAALIERLRGEPLLLRAAVGVGPLVAAEVAARAADTAPEAVAAALAALVAEVDERPEPGLADGRALPFRPRAAVEWQPAPSMREAVHRADAAVTAGSLGGTGSARRDGGSARRDLAAELRRRCITAGKRLERLEAERGRHPDETTPRRYAETLLAAADRIPRGAAEIRLPAADGEGDLVIPLDPGKSPAENADRWFKEARKARQSAERLPKEIDRASREAARYQAFETRLAAIPDHDTGATQTLTQEIFGTHPAGNLRNRLSTQTPRQRTSGSAARQSDIPASMLPKRYLLPGGWTVLVGRSNTANDFLTHRLAEPHDLWFHAHGCAGSHVVLKAPNRTIEPDRAVIEAAAALAALNSKARNAARVPVIYAEKRHVRKPRGGKPGLAAVTNEKSVMVKPGEPAGIAEDA